MSDKPPTTSVWKTSGIFAIGMLVGAVLALSAELVLREMQPKTVDIRLPSAGSTPIATTASPATVGLPQASSPLPSPPESVTGSPSPSPTPTPTKTTSATPSPLSPKLPKLPTTQKEPPVASPTPTSTKRISFDAGSTGSTLEGTVKASESQRYLMECNSGQQMNVQVEKGSVNVTVIGPDGIKIGTVVAGETQWQGQLPSSGDYTVEISAPHSSNYAVKVEVL